MVAPRYHIALAAAAGAVTALATYLVLQADRQAPRQAGPQLRTLPAQAGAPAGASLVAKVGQRRQALPITRTDRLLHG